MDFLTAIAQYQRHSDDYNDLLSRVPSLTYGVVIDTNDPEGLRRLRCKVPNQGTGLTDWLYYITPLGIFPALPEVGTTVLIGYIDGSVHNGAVIGIVNNTLHTVNTVSNTVIRNGDSTIELLEDGTINITAKNVTINGKSITTVGARDSRNDTIVTKGY